MGRKLLVASGKNTVAADVAEAGMDVKAHNAHRHLDRPCNHCRALVAKAAAQLDGNAAVFFHGLLRRFNGLPVGWKQTDKVNVT